VDARLVKLMPLVYGGVLRYNAPNGNKFTDGVSGPPPVPEQGSTHALNLANERVQLLATLAEKGAEAAQNRITKITPKVFASVTSQTPAVRVSQTRATGLAAMSIATDRLPKAIMVSTPTGDAHAQVAANFAAALSRLGLKVALMATSADQDWYLDSFTTPNGMLRLPELLDRAQSGTLAA